METITKGYQYLVATQFLAEKYEQSDNFFYISLKKSPDVIPIEQQSSVRTVDISNHQLLESLWKDLSGFLAEGKTQIAVIWYDEYITWKDTAQFVYQFMRVLGNHSCDILLFDFKANLFSGFFEGAIKAFACETQRIQLTRVRVQDEIIPALIPSLFKQCFLESSAHYYHLKHQELSGFAWQPIPAFSPEKKRFSGNVLITGGSGAVGRLLAHHLHHIHGCQVFLVGRKALNQELTLQLKEIKAKAYFQADCTQLHEMLDVCEYINSHYGRINHIFHLAGSINDALFINKPLDDFLNTIAVKISGAQVIEQLALQFKPESVCLFSSLSAIIGNAGQTDYAAANASLNELAEINNGKNGASWFAINWGLWQTESGMQMQDSAIKAMKAEDALSLLDTIYAQGITITTVYNGMPELLQAEKKPQSALEQNSSALSHDKARQRIKEIIVECTKIKKLDNDTSLFEKGVDSIIATHIATHIEKELSQSGIGCKIPKTLVFQHATVNQIFDYLLTNHLHALNSVFASSAVNESHEKNHAAVYPQPTQQNNEDNRFAIVSAAGEFPDALDLNEFWQMLQNGEHAIKPIPAERWDWQQQFSLEAQDIGASYCRHGGFLQNVALFDNRYFKITPRDAQKMTPEARRLLHQSYYALEQCNFLKGLDGDVGVFIANMYSHYQNLDKESELFDSSLSAMANHISYAFNFSGPSMGVDSMCSGGLNALHVALNSLKLKDCNAVLVGAANIMSHPGKYRFLSEGKFLSPSGLCRSFAVGADGYVPGEGVVVLIIKRYQDAIQQKDKILGIIRGTAINSNGANSAMTVPSANAQAKVIKKALLHSALNSDDISYIETHGTGTSLGDPIEIEGLKQVYGQNKKAIALGALKSNIGHLEGAAGLASLIKVLLQMHYRKKVPSLHCTIENPLLGLKDTPFVIQKKLEPWGEPQQTLYAGISAFGAGGSNAHVILESPPQTHAYPTLPQSTMRFDSKKFWLRPDAPVSTPKSKSVEIDRNKAVWLTAQSNACDTPLVPAKQDTTTFFIVTPMQKQMLHLIGYTSELVLLHEAVEWLDNHLKTYAMRKLVFVNVTSLDEQEGNETYLKEHFNLAKKLTNKNARLDFILINRKTHSSLSSSHRAAVDGLYRTLSLENPDVTSLVIQSDESLTQIVQLCAVKEIKEYTGTRYQWDGEQWQALHFAENERLLENAHTSLLKENGVYLISGGLGALGQIITRCLLKNYNAQVICLGRSQLSGTKLHQLQQLQEISSRLDYYSVDINDKTRLEQTIEQIMQKHGRLDGVLSSACVLNDGLLREKSWDNFSEVIQAKIQGTINLDEVTRTCSLDFFVSFSSMSAVYSNVGQADYCLANTFVDYFTAYRESLVKTNARSGKSITINWPLWEVEGLSLSPQTIQYLCDATGITPLNAEQGALLFERLMDQKHPYQIIPLHGTPDTIRTKLLAHKTETKPVAHTAATTIALVSACISEVTHCEPSTLHAETSINELGMSSVLLTELATLLEKKVGVSIAPSAFFSHNTISKIALYLSQKTPERSLSTTAASESKEKVTQAPEAFAIIGLSALLPGGPDPEAFWELLCNNQSAVRKVERWVEKDYYAATLENIKHFDNQFFNLSNKEAMLMDPQHRLFLQESYRALLDAGYPPTTMRNVGVFAGVQFTDYQNLLSQHNIAKHPYMATGNSHSMLANRVSYLFDFNGPSQTIDTACSSTLIAINRGILALKNKECDLALCGAVSLLIDASVTEAAQSMGVLSPNSRCATFDEQADGYVRGEGVGVFVIKRLGDALRDKDAIHAVITSSAENHGGRANSLTAPNPLAQKELLLRAYDPVLASKVSYIETHGTGTRLGDPIEIDALKQAFYELVPEEKRQSIILGSVKTNVGHLEPAAGVASLIKVIYALKNQMIPANLHFNRLNPYIDLLNSPFKIADKNSPWNDKKDYVAGISSFGFGGSYAHIVLEKAPVASSKATQNASFYFPLSARKPELLQAMKDNLASYLEKTANSSLEQLSYMLCCCREHFNHREMYRCSSREELLANLRNNEKDSVGDEQVIRAYLDNKEINWASYFPEPPTKAHIPGYIFEKKEFWFDSIIEPLKELSE